MVNYVLLLFPSEPNSPERLVGRLLIFSGKTGEVLRWVRTPDERETYFSPAIYTKKDSTELVLFGTGGETHPGGLYVVPLIDLFHGLIENSKLIYKDDYKGMKKNLSVDSIDLQPWIFMLEIILQPQPIQCWK